MQSRSQQPSLVLALFGLIGLLLLLAGLAGVAMALIDPQLVRDRLSDLAIDAAAVGGAMAALGTVVGVIGAAHLVVAGGLRRGARWSLSAGIGLAMALAAICLAGAAAALVAAVSGRPLFIGLGFGLIVVAATYGLVGFVLIGQKLASASR